MYKHKTYNMTTHIFVFLNLLRIRHLSENFEPFKAQVNEFWGMFHT